MLYIQDSLKMWDKWLQLVMIGFFLILHCCNIAEPPNQLIDGIEFFPYCPISEIDTCLIICNKTYFTNAGNFLSHPHKEP